LSKPYEPPKVLIIDSLVQVQEKRFKRVYEVCKELGIPNKIFLQRARALGFEINNHMSTIEDEVIEKVKADLPNPLPEYPTEPRSLGGMVFRNPPRPSRK
jgi:hypothetical protein